MSPFFTTIIQYFCVAFGVVLGGSLLGGIGAVLTLSPPIFTMNQLADKLKIWALVAAIGGTIDPIRAIENDFLDGQFPQVVKQILYIASAFIGAQIGSTLVHWLGGVRDS